MFPPERLDLARRFVGLLAGPGVERGLIGPRESPRLWDRHVLNCAAVAGAIPLDATVTDLGAGAGLPGLVVALVRPDVTVTLIEPLLRRTTFLDEVVAALELGDQVRVLRGRAEDLHGREQFDVVTARALAPLERLLGWAMPLVAPSGELLAMKGTSAEEEIAASSAALRLQHCAEPRIEAVRAPGGSSTATIVRVAHAHPSRVS